jgi:tRNA isopentenyl-2-thiomethyl-A-37 hydroxylase MiaE
VRGSMWLAVVVVMAQPSRAARSMALMIRRYVPQRQMLPSMSFLIKVALRHSQNLFSREGWLLRRPY